MRRNRIGFGSAVFVCLSVAALALPACMIGDEGDERASSQPDEGGEPIGQVAQAMAPASLCSDPWTATITGTAGNDYIVGTSGADVIFAFGGDDLVDGGGGDDIICGGAGNDNLRGGDGDDRIEGGAGYNWLRGDGGDDLIIGGDNGNEILGGAGNDALHGGTGAETIYGGAGDDAIEGGAGNDYIVAGTGGDCIDGGAGTDNIYGGDGDDSVKGGADYDFIYCEAGSDTYEPDGIDTVSGCETTGTVECFTTALSCSCNTPGSLFEALVSGNIPFTINVDGFCADGSSLSSLYYSDSNGYGSVDAGELGGAGTGFWACGSWSVGLGYVDELIGELSPAEGLYCVDLMRNALIDQGVNLATDCVVIP